MLDSSAMVGLMRSGKTIEMRDALIAGCMLKSSCHSIVTRNAQDFSRIPKIEVIPY